VPAPFRPVNGCAVFDSVDIAKLPKGPATDQPVVTVNLAKRHAGWRNDSHIDAEIALDSVAPLGGMRTTTIAGRIDGVWHVSAVRTALAGDRGGSPRETRQTVLDGEQTKALEAVLADPCFWTTPPVLPNDVPLKNGKSAICFDGVNTIFRVRVGDRKWYGEQDCRALGLPARLASILWRAALPAQFGGMFTTVR
jgi:hypothetical protein